MKLVKIKFLILLLFQPIAHCGEPFLINESLVLDALKNFYHVLDINNYDKEKLQNIVTDDFLVFEASSKMNIDDFHSFLTHKDPNAEPLVETTWKLSDFRIYISDNSAHASYMNRGIFQHGTSLRVTVHWMESALLTNENGKLKMKFLNSNLITKNVEEFPPQPSG